MTAVRHTGCDCPHAWIATMEMVSPISEPHQSDTLYIPCPDAPRARGLSSTKIPRLARNYSVGLRFFYRSWPHHLVSRHLQYMFGTSNLHKHFNTRYALFDDGIKSPWERPAVTSAFAIASPGSTQHLHKTLIPGTLHVPVVVLEKLLRHP